MFMINFNFTSQICTTKEQSERLLALGLKKETADMMYVVLVKDFRGKDVPNAERIYSLCTWYKETSMSVGLEKREYIPAWSLHRLIEMYTEHYVCEHINLKLLTYDVIIENIRLDILSGTFNKEYLN